MACPSFDCCILLLCDPSHHAITSVRPAPPVSRKASGDSYWDADEENDEASAFRLWYREVYRPHPCEHGQHSPSPEKGDDNRISATQDLWMFEREARRLSQRHGAGKDDEASPRREREDKGLSTSPEQK